jgi:uncharacterized coiled-coil protein SlyX
VDWTEATTTTNALLNAMEIRQRRLESQVAIQNEQIERLQKELAIHREFLDIQFGEWNAIIRLN